MMIITPVRVADGVARSQFDTDGLSERSAGGLEPATLPNTQGISRAAGTRPSTTEAQGPLTALMLAVAIGDRGAFKSLYRATSAKLLGLAMFIVKRRDAAEDVLQEAYLRIWARADRFDPSRGAPLPWMAQFVRHAAIDRLRKDCNAPEDIACIAETFPAVMASAGDRLDMNKCLAALAPAQRKAIMLAYLYGYTNQQIADYLGKPVGTVKSWIRRAAAQIREHMDDPIQ